MHTRILSVIAWLLFWCVAASAQTVTVIGPITPGDCPQFSSTTIIKDSGFNCNGGPGGAAGGVLSGTYPNPGFSSAVNSALTQTNAQFLIGTGAFGFSSLAPQAALNAIFGACGVVTAGTIGYFNGTNWVCLAGNSSGTQALVENSSGVPSWSSVSGITLTAGTGISFTSGSTCTTSCTVNLVTPVSAANGGTGVASPTAHSVPINEGSSAQNNTGTGTLGQGVISGGASADPSFKSGPRTLINTVSVTGAATLDDTSDVTSSYNHYELEITACLTSSANDQLELLVHSGGAFPATSYLGTILNVGNGASAVANTTTFLPLTTTAVVQTTGAGYSGNVRFDFPSQTTTPKNFTSLGNAFSGTVSGIEMMGGFWNGGNGAIDGFRLKMATGNITCRVDIYGWL